MKIMRNAIPILCAMILLFYGFARAEKKEPLMLETEEPIALHLLEYEADEGRIHFLVRCVNMSDRTYALTLFAPEYDHTAALFANGWDTDEILMEGRSDHTVMIALCLEESEKAAEIVSFRFICDGSVSSPFSARFGEEGCLIQVSPASLPSDEPPIVRSEIPGSLHSLNRYTFSDCLTEKELELLDYGQAVLCLRQSGEEGERFIPFCVLPAHVEQNGSVTADFLGFVPVFSTADTFPLRTVEIIREDTLLLRVYDLSLSGEAVFYADFSFEVRYDNAGNVSVSGYTVDTGFAREALLFFPAALFDTVRASHPVIRLETLGDRIYPETDDIYSLLLQCDASLQVEMRAVEELGTIYVYFEYFFEDGDSNIHHPFPIS